MGMEKCNPASVLGSSEKLTESELEEENVELDAEGASAPFTARPASTCSMR